MTQLQYTRLVSFVAKYGFRFEFQEVMQALQRHLSKPQQEQLRQKLELPALAANLMRKSEAFVNQMLDAIAGMVSIEDLLFSGASRSMKGVETCLRPRSHSGFKVLQNTLPDFLEAEARRTSARRSA